MDLLGVLFRWIHVAAGILWIGILYWFNFVNIPFAATMDGETKKKVIPELLPRSLYFFRWAAMWTLVTGLMLLGMVFYHGELIFDEGKGGWGAAGIVSLVLVFGMFGLYNQLAKSSLGKNLKVFGAVGFVIVGLVMYLMIGVAEFSYRAYVIHIGVMFGMIMAANVWMVIWPVQKKVMAALKQGTAPDAALVAMAGQRSRHNTYLSVPLVYAMLNMHSVVPGSESPVYFLAAILVGWGSVALVYAKSTKVKGL